MSTGWQNRIVGHGEERPESLIANPRNWRTHPVQQEQALRAVLEEVGWVQDVVVNKRTGLLVDGHLRVQVAQERGEDLVPVVFVDLSEEEEALVLATLDPMTGLAGKDDELLSQLLEEVKDGHEQLLKDLKFDLQPVEGNTDPEEIPPLLEEPVTQPGDLWVMGDHALLCGDSTSTEDVERLMFGERAQLCFTSPPYWVGKEYEKQTTLSEVKSFIVNVAKQIAAVVKVDGGRVCLNTSTANARAIDEEADIETLFSLAWWQDAFRQHNWLMRHCRIWVKKGQLVVPRVSAKSDTVDQHWETVATFLPTFYNPEGLKRGQEKIGMKWAQQGIWNDVQGSANMKEHGAAFPVELPTRYIKLYSVAGELIFEPFCGTGTTIIACEQLSRRCFAMELDPGYCDVAVKRWENFTGQKAELAVA